MTPFPSFAGMVVVGNDVVDDDNKRTRGDAPLCKNFEKHACLRVSFPPVQSRCCQLRNEFFMKPAIYWAVLQGRDAFQALNSTEVLISEFENTGFELSVTVHVLGYQDVGHTNGTWRL